MARQFSVRIDDKMASQLDEYRDWVLDQFGMNLVMCTAMVDMAVLGLRALQGGYGDMGSIGLARSSVRGDDENQDDQKGSGLQG